MAFEIPVVRHFVGCLEVVVEPGSRNATLRNLVQVIVRLPGEAFPCMREQMALFAVITNGRGAHQVAVELTFLEEGVERTVYQSAGRRIDLGQDPTMVHGLPIPLRNIAFDRPGQYTFYLLCDGQQIAEEHVEVR